MMDVQKRQAYEASDRFQKHLEKVLEIIKQNLNEIPEQDDIEGRLKLSEYYRKDKKSNLVNCEDQMMCDIADML